MAIGKYLRRVISSGLVAVALAVFASPLYAAVSTDSKGRPLYVDKQLIITLKTGSTQSDLDSALAQMGAKVIRKLSVADTYLVELLPTRGETPSVETAETRSRSVDKIAMASPNYYRHVTENASPSGRTTRAVPSDPRWSEQWDMRMIEMPAAWDVSKGDGSVTVAVVDSGVSLTHPDLQGRLVQGRDVAMDDDDPSPSTSTAAEVAAVAGHGTHVSGTVAAQGGNDIGVSGVCWDNVKIMPVKVMADDVPYMTDADIADGLEWARAHGAQVVNMSLGGPSPMPAVYAKIKQLVAEGITIVVAAGNEYPDPVGYPAAYPEVICVSALGPTEAVSYYSCQGPEVDIAAPGGAMEYEGDPNGVLSTYWSVTTGDSYAFEQGTSMASPHVAGAVAMMLSVGVSPADIKAKLYSAARPPVNQKFDTNIYGAGVLDVYNAIAGKSGGGFLSITEPANGSAVASLSPGFKLTYSKVAADTIKVYLDYLDENSDGIPDDLSRDVVIDSDNIAQFLTESAPGTLSFHLPLPGFDQLTPESDGKPKAYKIYAVGDKDDGSGDTVSTWGIFFISPHVIIPGLHLMSVPYPVAANQTPESLFGTGNSIYRLEPAYQPTSGSVYAIWDPSASFTSTPNQYAWPTDAIVNSSGGYDYTLKRGTAFWFKNTASKAVNIATQPDLTECNVRLVGPSGATGDVRKGWNMFGNPFPFKVDWTNVRFTYQGRTLPTADAVAAGWIRPNIWHYDSGYSFQTAPQGIIEPWEGHWVYALVGSVSSSDSRQWLVMTIPPLQSDGISRAANPTKASGTDTEWTMRLSARCEGIADTYNYVGVSAKAVDGYGQEDVPKPVSAVVPVELNIVHKDWGSNSGIYQADYRNSSGSSKSWDIEVNTTVANQDVTLGWPEISNVPKTVGLTLEDISTGTKVYLRTRSSYTYNSGSGGVRRLKLTAEPESKGRLLVTNVVATRNRAGSVTISYALSRDARVEVKIRNAAGKHVKALGGNSTRAAGIGSVTWDGRSEDGKTVTTGVYIGEIVATGPDGEVAKNVCPILLK